MSSEFARFSITPSVLYPEDFSVGAVTHLEQVRKYGHPLQFKRDYGIEANLARERRERADAERAYKESQEREQRINAAVFRHIIDPFSR